MIQDAWMNSPKHRENLLGPRVDSIGIRVIARGDRLYAVEDLDRSVTNLSLEQQEVAVAQLLQSKSSVAILPTTEERGVRARWSQVMRVIGGRGL